VPERAGIKKENRKSAAGEKIPLCEGEKGTHFQQLAEERLTFPGWPGIPAREHVKKKSLARRDDGSESSGDRRKKKKGKGYIPLAA